MPPIYQSTYIQFAIQTMCPILVRDLMTIGVATCAPQTPVVDLARWMLDKGLEAFVVLDGEEGHALGIVGQDELVRAYAHSDVSQLKAMDILHEGVPEVPPDVPVTVAAQLMLDQGLRALFLMHHSAGIEYPAAVITYQHLLRHLAARDASELRDLGLHAGRQSPLDAFIQRRDATRKKL
jgi:CBS-domain-containing membrane protein